MDPPTSNDVDQCHTEWACLVSQDYCLSDDAFRAEALAFAMQLMARFKIRVFQIAERLQSEGYRFAIPENVLVEPESSVSDWINEFRQRKLYVPIALEAWLRVIGGVNFMGTHPDWPRPAYAFDDDRNQEYPIYADPLVVEMPEEYAVVLYDEWIDRCQADEEPGPYLLEIAPDHIHKANISGGMPYRLSTDRPAIDRMLLNERHATSFVGYLRAAVRWHGFPGFDYMRNEIPKGWETADFSFPY